MEDRTAQREQVKSRIIDKAKKDPAFKAQLLKDSRKAIESELGVQLPSHVQFQVVQETAANLCIVLPEEGKQELSDSDLESVSGGAVAIVLMY